MTRIRNFFHFDEIHKKQNINIYNQIFGLLLYIIIFVMMIPIILYKYRKYTLLEVYLPNIDLIANLFSFHEGPFNIWKELYVGSPTSTFALMSQIIINYIALVGLSYLFIRETKITKSIYRGWSLAIIMILITYLLPSQLISYIMEIFERFISKFNSSIFCYQCIKIYTFIIGLLITICVILFEKFLIFYYRDNVINISKLIIKIPKLF
tara:strand:+ start:183 stop:809 length:627 start_codon:yes stop_codon:yes gene_type:complete